MRKRFYINTSPFKHGLEFWENSGLLYGSSFKVKQILRRNLDSMLKLMSKYSNDPNFLIRPLPLSNAQLVIDDNISVVILPVVTRITRYTEMKLSKDQIEGIFNFMCEFQTSTEKALKKQYNSGGVDIDEPAEACARLSQELSEIIKEGKEIIASPYKCEKKTELKKALESVPRAFFKKN